MRKILLLTTLAILAGVASGQTSYSYRYWIDNDLGSVVSGSGTGETQFSANLSAVGSGLHALHVQARNSSGVWSSTHTRYFMKSEQLVATTARYWFDNDMKTLQDNVATSGVIELDISALKAGLHTVHYQTLSASGIPSSTHSRYFMKSEQLIATTARYWFDNNLSTLHTDVATSGIIDLDVSPLLTGLHAVHYQTYSSDGTASSVRTRFFLLTDYQNKHLTCQIWFDDDEGNAITYPVTGEDIQLNISKLSIGMHNFTVVLYDGSGVAVGRETQPFEVEGGKDYITLSSFGLDTYSSQSDLDFSSSTTLKAYIASGYDVTNETIILNRVYKVPAGTGLIVMGTAEKTYEVKQTAINYIYANMLKGVITPQTIPVSSEGYTHFVLEDGPLGHAFYQLPEDKELSTGSVYLAIPTSVLPTSGKIKIAFNEGLKGDVNEDGAVDIADAVQIVNFIVGKISALAPRSEMNMADPE